MIDLSPSKPEILDRSDRLPEWFPPDVAPELTLSFVVIGHFWLFWAQEHSLCLHRHFLCSDGPSFLDLHCNYSHDRIKHVIESCNKFTWKGNLTNPILSCRIWCKENDFLNHLNTSKSHQAVHILDFDRTAFLLSHRSHPCLCPYQCLLRMYHHRKCLWHEWRHHSKFRQPHLCQY